MNFETLKAAVLAADENRKINDGAWSSWGSGSDILETYELGYDSDVAEILDRAIQSNGKSLPADLRAAELKELGQNFGAPGFAHPGNASSANPYWIDRIEAIYG